MSGNSVAVSSPHPIKWATARILFYIYLVFSLFSVVGGFITAPLMSWSFFGTW
jgi:hypothetical protein